VIRADYARTLALLSLGQIVSWAALYFSFTSFVLPMQRTLGWSKPLLMGAFTLGLAVWGVASIPVGVAIDRGHGRRVLAGGAALAGIGCLLWSQVSAPWMLYAVWCLLGVAMAMTLYEPAFVVVTRRFPTRYRDAITVLTLVGGFATTLSFPATAWLLNALGWRSTLVMLGLVLLIVIAPAHAFALTGSDGPIVDPEPSADRPPAAAGPTRDATMQDALHTSAFWFITITFAGYSFAAAALWAHMIPALAAKGIDETHALAVLLWVGPAQVGSRVLLKLFGSGVSPRALGYWVYVGQAAAFVTFAFASSTAGLIAWALVYGTANGLVPTVRGGLVPEYFGRRHLGRISGTMSSLALYARAAAPLGTAALLALPLTYDRMMAMLAALTVLTLFTYAAARKPRFDSQSTPGQ
jgi:hypothetical protein